MGESVGAGAVICFIVGICGVLSCGMQTVSNDAMSEKLSSAQRNLEAKDKQVAYFQELAATYERRLNEVNSVKETSQSVEVKEESVSVNSENVGKSEIESNRELLKSLDKQMMAGKDVGEYAMVDSHAGIGSGVLSSVVKEKFGDPDRQGNTDEVGLLAQGWPGLSFAYYKDGRTVFLFKNYKVDGIIIGFDWDREIKNDKEAEEIASKPKEAGYDKETSTINYTVELAGQPTPLGIFIQKNGSPSKSGKIAELNLVGKLYPGDSMYGYWEPKLVIFNPKLGAIWGELNYDREQFNRVIGKSRK